MKKIAIIICAAAVIFGGYKFAASGKKQKKVSYGEVAAALGSIQEIVDTTGEVTPLNRVEIKPAISGRVDSLTVDEGDDVKKGQILAYLSSSDRVAILDAARAKGEAEVKYWEDTYKPTPVISPLDGKIILRNVVQGQTVDASTILFALADNLIVGANVDESDIGRIKSGQRAAIRLDAYPDQSVSGTVFQILYEGKNVSNVITYRAKIRPDYLPDYFKSQMTANIQIVVKDKKNAVLVPTSVITESTAGFKTVLAGSRENPQPVEVQTGLDDGIKTEILSGVQPGEKLYYIAHNYKPQAAAESGGSPFMPFMGRRKDAQQQAQQNKSASSGGGASAHPRNGTGNGTGGGKR